MAICASPRIKKCWPEQAKMEQALSAALGSRGYELVRAHAYKEQEGHGFISSQKEGLEVFRKIDPTAPLIVAEAVWQYSHHILPGLMSTKGPFSPPPIGPAPGRLGGVAEPQWLAHQKRV